MDGPQGGNSLRPVLLYSSEVVRVRFYMKAGCWLCDSTEETLNGLKVKHGLVVEKVHIDSDPGLYEMYRFDIPVLEFKDGTALHGRIKKGDLLKAINANKE